MGKFLWVWVILIMCPCLIICLEFINKRQLIKNFLKKIYKSNILKVNIFELKCILQTGLIKSYQPRYILNCH